MMLAGRMVRENVRFLSAGILWLCAACAGTPPGSAPAAIPTEFGGSFEQLQPRQQRFVSDWLSSVDAVTRDVREPGPVYDALPHSTRSTIEAVSHALLQTSLTDEHGSPSGVAFELVRLLETAHGRIPGTGGDQQFRLFVYLEVDAVERLEASREFSRHGDNLVFHLEYPINYRQDGTPSIQFSISRDGLRADIDVDYRSSRFPAVLFDGHLSVANSDVRAGDNYERHSGRWRGLVSWWRNVFGLPFLNEDMGPVESSAVARAVEAPRVDGDAPLAVAVEDFLSTWLVQRTPDRVAGYFSVRSYACVVELEPGATDTIQASLRIARDMREINLAFGTIRTLSDVVQARLPDHLSAHRIRHAYDDQFALFELSADHVDGLECPDPNRALPPWLENRDQAFYGASFRIGAADGGTFDLFQIWSVEEGHWRIVAFHVDLHASTMAVPGARPATAAKIPTRPADPELASSFARFFERWLIDDGDVVSRMSSRSFECAALVGDVVAVGSFPDSDAFVSARMKEVARLVGGATELRDAIRSFEPWDPGLEVLSHSEDAAFALVRADADQALRLDCRKRRAGLGVHPGEPLDGLHWATFFRIAKAGPRAPVVVLLWAREDDLWKVISYDVLLP